MKDKMRKMGIKIVGDVPWGTHLCQFYKTKKDLVDILVPYFKAGLENNEFCMWVASEPLNAKEARAALKKSMKNLDKYIRSGQLEILDYKQWYVKSGKFEADTVLKGWVKKEKQAIKAGFDGLRLTGNTFWLEKRDWNKFADYEAAVNGVIGEHRMIAICTYSLDKCNASEIIDVVYNHQFALIKHEGSWRRIDSSEGTLADEKLMASRDKIESLSRFPSENPNPVLRMSIEKEILYKNEAVTNILNGLGLSEKDVFNILPKDIKELSDKALKLNEPIYDLDMVIGEKVYSYSLIPVPESRYVNIYATDTTDRKKAEEEKEALNTKLLETVNKLQEEEQKLQNTVVELQYSKEYTENIVSSMIDALIVLNPEGIIQAVNQATCDLLGFKENSLLGKPVGTYFAEEEEEEEDLALYDIKFKKLLRKGPIIDLDASLRAKGGKKIPVSVYGSVIRDKKDNLVGVVLTARDMRAKIAAETALKGSEEKYRGLVESLTDSIFLLDAKGCFINVNKPGLELHGWKDNSEAEGKSFLTSSHKRYRSVLKKAFEVACSGEPAHFNYESTTKDGAHRWWDCSLVPFRDAGGNISNAIGISRDITQRKHTDKLIKFFREYAEHIVANLPISVLIIDRDLKISFVNEHFLKKIGQKRDQLAGRSLETVLGRGYRSLGLDEKILKVIKHEEMIKGSFELRTKYYDYQIVRFKERIGRRFNAMLIMEDVTERMNLEEQLRHSERMSAVGTFTASVAHEINNPLSIVIGNVQYLLANLSNFDFSDKKQVEDLSESLETIDEQSVRCGEIVTNLLHFSHKGKIDKEEISVTKIINRAVKMLEHQLRLAKVKANVQLAARLPAMIGDANLLQQVFINLTLNAQHAMPRGGKLDIKTYLEDSDWICISFKDDGPGIPKKHLCRIFEPFYSTKKAGEGTGLGLSVVHSIVEDHGGDISVVSRKGEGATFTVKLPVSKKKGLFGVWK